MQDFDLDHQKRGKIVLVSPVQHTLSPPVRQRQQTEGLLEMAASNKNATELPVGASWSGFPARVCNAIIKRQSLMNTAEVTAEVCRNLAAEINVAFAA